MTRWAVADAVSRLAVSVLAFDGKQGYLRSVLAALDIPIESGFGKTFTAAGRRDGRNRSLRELDLQTRLLKYRCSHMVYSPASDALPGEARAEVVARMKQILAGRADGAAVQDILSETLPGWR